jgi:hypothetical protein
LGTITPILFGSPQKVLLFQIGNDEGALKEWFSVTTNLAQQHVIVFTRGENIVYFHLTGMHLRQEKSAINRQSGPSLWTGADAAKDFDRQMSYWAARNTK